MQGRALVAVERVDLRAGGQEGLDALDRVRRRRPLERRVLRPIGRVHVGARLEQRGDARERVLTGGPVERRALLAIARVDVDLLAARRLQEPLEQHERVGRVAQAPRVLARQVQHRAGRLVLDGEARPRVDEREGALGVAALDGEVERRLHLVVGRVDVRALGDGEPQQRERAGRLAVLGHPVQRRHVILVAGRERRAAGDEHLRALEALRLAREAERRAQLPVLRLSRCARAEQCHHAVLCIELGREVERRLLARARLIDVDVARSEERAQAVGVFRAQQVPDGHCVC